MYLEKLIWYTIMNEQSVFLQGQKFQRFMSTHGPLMPGKYQKNWTSVKGLTTVHIHYWLDADPLMLHNAPHAG